MVIAKKQTQLDVIEAYDRLGLGLAAIRAARQAYCDGIDQLILADLPAAASSLLDVGSGEGERAEAIARTADVDEITLLEPSAGMRSLMQSPREIWTDRIEDLPPITRRFEVITCLWNVLGHVPSPEMRLQALRTMCSLLSPNGRLFLDVQNRYNARAYGTLSTFGRWLQDRIAPSPDNGDVTVRWKSNAGEVVTYGHVFTPHEMSKLIGAAGLKIVKQNFVDYGTGKICDSQFSGSMFFVLTC